MPDSQDNAYEQTLRAELVRARDREAATREILTVISQSRDDETPVFQTIVENAARLCSAPMTFVVLINEDHTEWKIAAATGEATTMMKVGNVFQVGREFAPYKSVKTRRIVEEPDIRETEFYKSRHADAIKLVDVDGILSRVFVPLVSQGKSLGNLVLLRREVGKFAPDDLLLVDNFATEAVIAIENARQFRALEKLNAELGDRVEEQVGEIERMSRLKRFLPNAVADTVISSGSEALLKSHRSLLGVIFCDIRGFTAFCETAEPEETIEVLQTYHEEMGKLINAHGAGVDHRMGDGIMVLFNDPLPCEDPAGDAVRLAVAMRAKMVELSKQWKRLGHRLGFGVGVSLGYATVGMVGYEDRSDYTASGTAINVAARLCDMAEDGEILLSTRAAIAVEEEFPSVSAGEVTLKGIREPVEVFRMTFDNAE
ncbi:MULTISPECIES: adenylate/guanylate cyclase domain-containing protein [unclassified Ruegeria]|uniref:adenylate/guanylate cyclase domain-containing protein n=1 Tax=unclassified Ruegeria TaxID=2625375 RepID=UPI00147B1CBE|nr:GAF domain-containing protein [Ruegeria sp. HKCCD7296]NOD48462.1 GAF domain-containing protein [Ruegeria sp. HKCCD5849]NOD52482.1 GAF domain-containing protein [Ruegeria sp. HKCCD5851]NOD68585.1 GAF domain-containing protein [Ruegeria sp. HKCCD7303]NOE43109.1 GAF domain-containing protein [Ruegeria sp. HKCCD7319]